MKIKNITHVSLMALMLGVLGSLPSLNLAMAEDEKVVREEDSKVEKAKKAKGVKKVTGGTEAGAKKGDASTPIRTDKSTLGGEGSYHITHDGVTGSHLFRASGNRKTEINAQVGSVKTTDPKAVRALASHGKIIEFQNASATVQAKRGSSVGKVLEGFATSRNLPLEGPGGQHPGGQQLHSEGPGGQQVSVTGHGRDALDLLRTVSDVKGNEVNSNNKLTANHNTVEIGSNDTTMEGFTYAEVRGIVKQNDDALEKQNQADLFVLRSVIEELERSGDSK